ncbi:hypothetical protein ACIRYZ_10805 [Kitasatospora sp. NPDC101155]|uniref:hypothetical protein n=1 Tax=Kitasatospora sp. NPDC101155 TaxID=3364097 RepID=UPI00380DED11
MSPVRTRAGLDRRLHHTTDSLEPVMAATRRPPHPAPSPSGPRRSAGDRLRRNALATAAAGWADFSPAADPRIRPAS